MSSSPPSSRSCRSPPSLDSQTETDKRATRTIPHHPDTQVLTNMEEGVDIHSYEDSLHYNAYSFDVAAHANSVVDAGNPMEDVVVGVGIKRPLEEETTATTDPMMSVTTTAPKRYKTNDEGRRNNNSAAAAVTNKQWDAMFERLVAFKQRNGVRGTHDDGSSQFCPPS